MQSSPAFEYFGSADDRDFHITTLGRIDVAKGSAYPPCGHPAPYEFEQSRGRILPEFQIHLIDQGTGLLETEATKGAPMAIVPGSAFILFPGVWHRYAPIAQTGWTEYWIGVSGRRAETLMRSRDIDCRRPLVVHQRANLFSAFHQALWTLGSHDPMADEVRRACAILMMAKIGGGAFEAAMPGSAVQNAAILLENPQAGAMSLAEIAAHLGVGYHFLRKSFREQMGISMGSYRQKARIERAADLLCRFPTLAIKEIAGRCGFSDPYYFSRAFADVKHMSPSAYRVADIDA